VTITAANVGSNHGTAVSSLTYAFTGVQSGSTLLLGIAQWAYYVTPPTYSVSDGVNTWVQINRQVGTFGKGVNRVAETWRVASSASGNLTVTVTPSATATFLVGRLEARGANGTVDTSATDDAASAATLYAAPATGFNPVANSIILGAIAPGDFTGVSTLDANYTSIISRTTSGSGPFGVVAYRIVGGSNLTNERMSWSVTNNRLYVGASASITYDPAYVPPGANPALLTQGAG